MIRANLTIKTPNRTFIRKLTFRDKQEMYFYKVVVKTIENYEVTNIVIL